ncbi:TPA: hypothetical protein ACG7RQ_001015 [Streptococcus agalactiae]
MEKFYEFIRNVIKSDYGVSIKDVMETNWIDMLEVLKPAEVKSEEVMSLEDFVGTLNGG